MKEECVVTKYPNKETHIIGNSKQKKSYKTEVKYLTSVQKKLIGNYIITQILEINNCIVVLFQ